MVQKVITDLPDEATLMAFNTTFLGHFENAVR